MAGSLNKVCLIGTLGKDPEVKTMQNGGRVCNLSVATSESWKDKATGEKKEKTEWHRITIWNDNLVRICEQYLSKGSKVYLEGQLETRKWTDQGGIDRYSTDIVLKAFNGQIIMLSTKKTEGDGQQSAPAQQSTGGQKSWSGTDNSGGSMAGSTANQFDDDIPFAWVLALVTTALTAFQMAGVA